MIFINLLIDKFTFLIIKNKNLASSEARFLFAFDYSLVITTTVSGTLTNVKTTLKRATKQRMIPKTTSWTPYLMTGSVPMHKAPNTIAVRATKTPTTNPINAFLPSFCFKATI